MPDAHKLFCIVMVNKQERRNLLIRRYEVQHDVTVRRSLYFEPLFGQTTRANSETCIQLKLRSEIAHAATPGQDGLTLATARITLS